MHVHIPFFFFKELEKLVEDFQRGCIKYTLHQGLFFLIAKEMAHWQGWGGDLDDFLPPIRRMEEDTPNDSHKWKIEITSGHRCSRRKTALMVKLDFDLEEEGGPKEEEGIG